jgi:hypothetical protein
LRSSIWPRLAGFSIVPVALVIDNAGTHVLTLDRILQGNLVGTSGLNEYVALDEI